MLIRLETDKTWTHQEFKRNLTSENEIIMYMMFHALSSDEDPLSISVIKSVGYGYYRHIRTLWSLDFNS